MSNALTVLMILASYVLGVVGTVVAMWLGVKIGEKR